VLVCISVDLKITQLHGETNWKQITWLDLRKSDAKCWSLNNFRLATDRFLSWNLDCGDNFFWISDLAMASWLSCYLAIFFDLKNQTLCYLAASRLLGIVHAGSL
jgi:hypothetical protein